MMKILIDFQCMQMANRFSDAGKYSLSLVQAMARNAGDHEIWVALNDALPGRMNDIYTALDGLIPENRIQQFHMPRTTDWSDGAKVWRHHVAECLWEAFLGGIQPDLIYIPSLFEDTQDEAISSVGKLSNIRIATAVTVHDLSLLRQSADDDVTAWKHAWRMNKIESLKRSDILFSVSENVRREILQILDISPDRVLNVSPAIGDHQATKISWDDASRIVWTAMESVVAKHPSRQRYWPMTGEVLQNTYHSLIKAIADINVDIEPTEEDWQEVAASISSGMAINDKMIRAGALPKSLRWRMEGSFDSTYSLALANRFLAEALAQRGHKVALHSGDGYGDFAPSDDFLNKNPRVAELHHAATVVTSTKADVTSRLMYPPRVDNLASRMNVLHAYAWEESGFPQKWVEDFNDALQGISCTSDHVRKIMVDNGVSVPLGICGNGVDHWDAVVADTEYSVPGKGFRFLHVSSCFPRKGVDVMLAAYGKAFTCHDDVSLIIKTFANLHNEVYRWLDEARNQHPDYPNVHIIEGDISDAQLKHLYTSCHALLAPSRAEGFGLPLAEAMLVGVPVITTAWGGQCDFCNDQTAWLVDYHFAHAQTHFQLHNSVWAEPDMDSLVKAMHEVRNADSALVKMRTAMAENLLRSRFKWSDTARQLEDNVRCFALTPTLPVAHTGWITTWNTRCGVATYASHLVVGADQPAVILAAKTTDKTFQDTQEVVRCWHQGNKDSLTCLEQEIARARLDVLIIQFHQAFFDFFVFSEFLHRQKAAGRVVIVMMHSTVDPPHYPNQKLRFIASALAECDRVLVHSIHDLNRLKQVGVTRNTAIFPHGIMRPMNMPPQHHTSRLHIATYGFFVPHKGLLELIDAVALMVNQGKDVELTMVNAEYPALTSRACIELAVKRIAQHGLQSRVRMLTQFLKDEESMAELVKADVVVYPYQETGESASGAVRYGLASGRIVAVTPLAIFDDLGDAVHRLPGTTAQEIACGLSTLHDAMRNDDAALVQTQQHAKRWCAAHSFPMLARRLSTMSRQLLRQRREEI